MQSYYAHSYAVKELSGLYLIYFADRLIVFWLLTLSSIVQSDIQMHANI
jgi:hypothetical protein